MRKLNNRQKKVVKARKDFKFIKSESRKPPKNEKRKTNGND